MNEETTITDAQLQAQIEAYRLEKQEHYNRYAEILLRVLQKACAIHFPEAFVQARPKSVDSFAEKCVRKAEKYKDAINRMTDLCGARVIVQTLDQVMAMRAFIKGNFKIVEEDIKGANFKDSEFGYRDVHYIIELQPESCLALGITDEEQTVIGSRRAEVQLRTWLQHAWADTLHDRMYKTTLKHPREFRRVAGLLAALMEDSDRTFNALATKIDGMLANYNAYASRENVAKEAARQEQILANIDEPKRPKVALQLARLVSGQGRYAEAIEVLQTYADQHGTLRPEILLHLGYALCKEHRSNPSSLDYQRGLALLEEAVALLEATNARVPLNTRRQNSLLARALARKAWALEAIPVRAYEARTCYQAALEMEPDNPYHLTDVIGHEIGCHHDRDIVNTMRAPMRAALETCREHILNNTEMPFACFAAGRLHLLLNEANEALNSYARGIAHLLSCDSCCPPDVLDIEEQWILRIVGAQKPKEGFDWTLRLLGLARRVKNGGTQHTEISGEFTRPVLLLAGGAATLNHEADRNRITLWLKRVFAGLRGTVISGGTDSGVPGCAGAAAAALGAERTFKLVGFRPRLLPDDAPADKRYDQQIIAGEEKFTLVQVIYCWETLLQAGITPEDVRLLGIGGGAIAAFEYRLALALGASTGVVELSGGAAQSLLADEIWNTMPNLLPLPQDPDTMRAFAHPAEKLAPFPDKTLQAMAQAFHANYVAGSQSKLPPTMRPWPKLAETFKTANLEQARYSVKILEACGFEVRAAADPANPIIFNGFTAEELERMSEMEHGRWNAERLQNGWRRGERDDAKKLHNCLVPWTDDKTLTPEIKGYDRQSVEKFPEILAKAGLEVIRRQP
ncbi:MAG: RyR domain-containing protein [Kiritimatiellia bacterium]